MTRSYQKLTVLWMFTIGAVFIFSIVLGSLMRLNQAQYIQLAPVNFYSFLTTHGLLMAGIWFVSGMVTVNYLLNRYVTVPIFGSFLAYVLTVVGVIIFLISTLVGNLHTGWYFLYPLPFYAKVNDYAPLLFFISLTIFGIGWLIWALTMVAAMLKKYSIRHVMGWHHLLGAKEPATPPSVLISFVSLVGIIACLLDAVVLLAFYYIQYFTQGSFSNDPLLMKNLTFFFGHTLVNEMLYLGVAGIYEFFPSLANKPAFKTTWYVALAWNATLLIVLTAYFHHLYMDFAQPLEFQMVGQVMSWMASLPAGCVTIFSVLITVYKSQMKWSLASLLYFFGVMFWAVGGVAALLDAAVVNNFVFHNTLWVPAHFHTYNLLGNVLFSLAFFKFFSDEVSNNKIVTRIDYLVFSLLIIGGLGFLFSFYIGGALSVPRRIDQYLPVVHQGVTLARIAVYFIGVYLLGVIIYFISYGKRCIRYLF